MKNSVKIIEKYRKVWYAFSENNQEEKRHA